MFFNLSLTDILFVLLSLIISLTIHEAMHGYVAHWLGDRTALESGRLTLNPLKHINLSTTIFLPLFLILLGQQPFFIAKPVPIDSGRLKYGDFGMAIVGIAGPLTNFLLAAVGALLLRTSLFNGSQNFITGLIIFVQVNIGFFIFNMIPFPPLDGSRLLYAFAPESIQNFMRKIESIGFVGIVIFMLFIFQYISGPIINIENILLKFLVG